jgi:hypothetical protein
VILYPIKDNPLFGNIFCLMRLSPNAINMLTLKFQCEEDLSEFVALTSLYEHPVVVDYKHLDIQGALPEAELELACNAFNAEVAELETSKFKVA